MTKALFTFNIRGTVNGKPFTKQNYISMLQVIAAYWEERPDSGARILSVFTNGATARYNRDTGETTISPGRTFTFAEPEGVRFIEHWEEFLEYMCFGPANLQQTQAPKPPQREREHRARRPMDAEIIEDDVIIGGEPEAGEATFE